jgi:c-di-GMP-binding flagellar brake protein YcgR
MTFSRYKVERKFARYALDVRATLITSEAEMRVRMLDISQGGVGLMSPAEIPEESSFMLEFEFPTIAGMFRAEARAQNRVGFRYGFNFINVDENSMALLRRYQRRWGVLAKENYAARD